MITNSNHEELEVFIVHARVIPKINEGISNMLNGKWFVQTIGSASEILKMKIACRLDVLEQILEYATSKEMLSVKFMNVNENGIINGIPEYDLAEADETNPRYIVTFDLVVIPDS